MNSLYFVSSNHNKYSETQSILQTYGILIKYSDLITTEIQSDSIQEIAIVKSKSAFAKVSNPVLVEDDGLFINQLNGFPGQYSSHAFKTLGNKGILQLLSNIEDRSASFISIFVYYDGYKLQSFIGQIDGKISNQITTGGWGYDPVFIPSGSDLTFGQLQLQSKKKEFSHRAKAIYKFVQWYNCYLDSKS